MHVVGYLTPEFNSKLYKLISGGDINSIRIVQIKVVDQDQIDKMNNIVDQYVHDANPISQCYEGGILVKLQTKKLSKHLDVGVLSIPRENWFNKEYKVKFTISKYNIKALYKKTSSGYVSGINFNLENLKLTS